MAGVFPVVSFSLQYRPTNQEGHAKKSEEPRIALSWFVARKCLRQRMPESGPVPFSIDTSMITAGSSRVAVQATNAEAKAACRFVGI